MCSVCTDPLSTYPTAEQLSKLKVDQWFKLGLQLGLTRYQLENLKRSSQPTAKIFSLAAKLKKIDLNCIHVVESLLSVGESKVAETVCSQQGLLVIILCVLSVYIITPRHVCVAQFTVVTVYVCMQLKCLPTGRSSQIPYSVHALLYLEHSHMLSM